MPIFFTKSGSFEDLVVTGSRLYVASSSIFFNNLVTSSTAISNVLMVSSSGQVFVTASSAIGGGSSTPSNLIFSGSVTASVNVGSTAFQIVSASITRTFMSNLGPQTWAIANSAATESGVISINSPQGNPGIIFGTSGSIIGSTFVNRFNFAVSSSYAYLGYGDANSLGSFAIFSGSKNINIGYDSPTDTGYRLLVSGSGISGSLNANNVLFVSGSSVGINVSNPNVYGVIYSGSVGLQVKDKLAVFHGDGTGSGILITGNSGGRTYMTKDGSAFVAYQDNISNVAKKWLQVNNAIDDNTPILALQDSIAGNGKYTKWTINASSSYDYNTTFAIRQYSTNHTYTFGIFDTTNNRSFSVKPNGDGYFSGSLFIGTGSVDRGYKLMVSGSGISGSFNANNVLFVSGSGVSISGSFTVVSGSTEFQVLGTGVKMGNSSSDAHTVTGSLRILGTGNTGSILTIIGSGSINPIFTVQGSQGELFSVTDSLSGSLFSVNDISGLPILDVNSDQTTKIGSYLAPGMYASTRVTANTGVTVIYSIPTASYDSAYFDYNIRSGSVGRAGQIIAMWSGSSVNYSEVSASSFGTTNTFVFGVSISGSNMILSGSAPTNGWTVKTIVKAI